LLPPTYQAGREYVIRSTQHAETVVGVSGESQAKQVADIELEVRTVCQKGAGEKNLRDVLIELTALKMNVRLGGVEMQYDSREAGSGETLLGQSFRNLVGKSFTVTLDPADVIVGTRGLEEFGSADSPLGQQFGPEQLKQIAMPALRLGVPENGAQIGQGWKHEREIVLGPEQKLVASFDVRYTRDELLENRSHGVIEYGADIEADLQTGGTKDPKTTIQIRKGRLNGAMSIDKELRFPRSGMAVTSMTMTLPNPVNPKEMLELPVEQNMSFDLLSTRRLGMFEKP
ncbi:MAG: hypothetical protein ABL994_25105, partial [Verrucomicrobiales bacterium]